MYSPKKLLKPVIGLAIVLSTAAQASLLDPLGWYYNEDHAGWTCRSMIDFDQRRETGKAVVGLPGNGEKHCGPTATANLLAWFANHHDPGLAPGPGDWQSDLLYDQATDIIDELGVEMDCCGVGSSDVHDSLVSRLDPDQYTVVTRARNDDESPNFRSLLEASLAGGMSVFAYGRYDVPETGEIAEDGIPILVRTGGHVVTLQDIRINGDDRRIRARNPWTSSTDNHFSQSTFSSREYFPVENTFYRKVNSGALRGPYTLSQLFYAGQSSTNKHLDWTSTVYPAWGLTILNQEIRFASTDPANFEFEALDVPSEPKVTILDIEGLEAMRWIWILERAGAHNSLRRVHIPSRQSTTFDDLEFQDPRDMAMDDRGSLWVVNGSSIVRIDALETEPRIGLQEELPVPIRSMAWDQQNRSLVALDESADELVILKLIEYGFITDHRPLPEGSGIGAKARIAAHNDGSGWWIADPDSGLWFLDGDPDRPLQQMQHPDLGMPSDVQVTDGGTVVVSDNGTIKAFTRNADGLTRDGEYFLDGQAAGDRVMVSRNHNNWNPDSHDDPSWEIMSPPEDGEEVMDCLADVDLDQSVGVTDLLVLLSDWNKDASPADLNGDAAVNVMDLLIILESWGPCPSF